MLLGFPAAGSSSEAAAEARSDIYDDAVEDMPPWSIDAAVKRWGKGNVPDLKLGPLNFNFAPAPAVLRAICQRELEDFDKQAIACERLLSCISAERAMDPKPMPIAIKTEDGRVLSLLPRRM
jgi:hypothetical protein